MPRYALSKVEVFEHPARPGRMVRAPVLLKYLFDAQGQPLGWSEFHIDDSTGWCLCRLDGVFDARLAEDPDVQLLPDATLDAPVTGRSQMRSIKSRLAIKADVESPSTMREMLNTVGRELGADFNVDLWRAER